MDQGFRIVLETDAPHLEWPLGAARIEAQGRLAGPPTVVVDVSRLGSFASGSGKEEQRLAWIRYYLYSSSRDWGYRAERRYGTQVVDVPRGENLLYIARHHRQAHEFLKEVVAGLGWKLRFDPRHKTFFLSEDRGEELVDYPLDLLSDSLKRLFFYGAVILTSQNATLVMDEPDVFAFPPYPRTLGEMIAGDTSNQYFLTTHNPYFLAAVAEKTPTEELALFVCFRDDEGATGARRLGPEQISRVIELGSSVFFNLDEFLGG